LDQANEKLEMALMDLELLRAEMNTDNNVEQQTDNSPTKTLEMKQLMQQNAKLKDTLVR